MNWKLNKKIAPRQIKGLKMTQFLVKSNIVTTGHKLQGQTKQYMIFGTWNYRCRNWVYVVMSRVKTLNGLLLPHTLKSGSILNN